MNINELTDNEINKIKDKLKVIKLVDSGVEVRISTKTNYKNEKNMPFVYASICAFTFLLLIATILLYIFNVEIISTVLLITFTFSLATLILFATLNYFQKSVINVGYPDKSFKVTKDHVDKYRKDLDELFNEFGYKEGTLEERFNCILKDLKKSK